MILRASSGTGVVLTAVGHTLAVVLCTDEVWDGLGVFRDVGRDAIRADTVVGECGRVTVIGVCAS